MGMGWGWKRERVIERIVFEVCYLYSQTLGAR